MCQCLGLVFIPSLLKGEHSSHGLQENKLILFITGAFTASSPTVICNNYPNTFSTDNLEW